MAKRQASLSDKFDLAETRQLLTAEQIDANMASIKKSFANYLTFGNGPTDALMANNAEWLDTLLYIPLLRDVGRHFSVNRMLTMDSVKLRLERDSRSPSSNSTT